MKAFGRFVDGLSVWSGKAVAWLMLPLVFELVYDTVARYLFNAPTIWSFDVSYMLSSVLFMIGGAYALLDEAHIRIEVFYQTFSDRGKALADTIGYLIFFFPSIGVLFYFGILFTAEAWQSNEHGLSSYWSPPLYHFKAVIPLAASLLLLEGMGKFIRAISTIIRGKES